MSQDTRKSAVTPVDQAVKDREAFKQFHEAEAVSARLRGLIEALCIDIESWCRMDPNDEPNAIDFICSLKERMDGGLRRAPHGEQP